MDITRYLNVNIFKVNKLDEAAGMIINTSGIGSTGVQLLVKVSSSAFANLKSMLCLGI